MAQDTPNELNNVRQLGLRNETDDTSV